MSASAVSARQVQGPEATPAARCQPVSSQVSVLGPVTGSHSGVLQDVSRAVTVIIAVVVGLTFLFGFGNVLSLALRLGVPVWVAPLIAPAVDLSILGLLLATRYLAMHGASAEDLRPLHRFTLFVSVMSLALNVAEPLLSGAYGKAAFDAVGPALLIGWAEVGPQVLQALARVSPSAAVQLGSEQVERDELESAALSQDDLVRARRADARYWASHLRPIPADVLRRELEIGTVQARELIAVVRREVAAKVCAAVA
ncbi:hypothetical protein C8D87_11574 [Lentzea atacamensis]|uniref:DUF2637 domain-containing protein n=1 Tax=Lentzea atacamensis TaxID=531938 RepID=A0ABX9DXX0_9PSEU|nr:hypothetical protein C8D87_11574 [Lentzea atacamensis]